MSIELTDEQISLINEAYKWYNSNTGEQIFQYSAPAGAGKSTVINPEQASKTYLSIFVAAGKVTDAKL